MKSIGQMLEKIDGLRGTADLTEWENDFVGSCMDTYGPDKISSHLSGKQVIVIERIYKKHFA